MTILQPHGRHHPLSHPCLFVLLVINLNRSLLSDFGSQSFFKYQNVDSKVNQKCQIAFNLSVTCFENHVLATDGLNSNLQRCPCQHCPRRRLCTIMVRIAASCCFILLIKSFMNSVSLLLITSLLCVLIIPESWL